MAFHSTGVPMPAKAADISGGRSMLVCVAAVAAARRFRCREVSAACVTQLKEQLCERRLLTVMHQERM